MAGLEQDPAPAPAIATAEALTAAYPDLVAGIRADAAAAERARIAAIDALGIAGHDQLVAAARADGAQTAADVALAVLNAERATRSRMQQSIAAVETVTAAVKPAPAAAGGADLAASTPEGWREEWARSAALQAEFVTAADYVAFKANAHKVRILGRRAG